MPEELKPYKEKERHTCPFYGFFAANGMMMDQHGNQCALVIDSYRPCQMEKEGEQPDWNGCPFKEEKSSGELEILIDRIQVFPQEFCPPGEKEWGGITLREWSEHILKTK